MVIFIKTIVTCVPENRENCSYGKLSEAEKEILDRSIILAFGIIWLTMLFINFSKGKKLKVK
jgi:hypothetical protein